MTGPTKLTADVLRERFPLPRVDPSADKYGRGVALVIGGSPATAGATALAGIAALRAGAGKLRIATVQEAVPTVSTAVLEAGVFAIEDGIERLLESADAVLLGTGMLDGDDAAPLLRTAIAAASRHGTALAVDACAVAAATDYTREIAQCAAPVLLLPNSSEAGDDSASDLARRFNATVAVRAPTTTIATPDGDLFELTSGDVGLATSGSGDVETGIALGLLARGAKPLAAAAWASHAHAEAGERAARRRGAPIGYLARELLDEVAAALN